MTDTLKPNGVTVRSEGQRLLLQLVGSLSGIGRELGGVPKQAVHKWRAGTKQPSAAARARLQATFGIPPRAWFVLPGALAAAAEREQVPPPAAEAAPAAPAPPAAAPPAASRALDHEPAPHRSNEPEPSTLEDVCALLAVIRRDRLQPDILPTERVKLANAEARILALRAKVELAAQLTESRFVFEHPAWLRLRRGIVQALEAHPLAAQAVVHAIESMERSV